MTWSTRVMNWFCVSSVRVRPRKLFAPVWLGSGWILVDHRDRERIQAILRNDVVRERLIRERIPDHHPGDL